MLPSHPAAAFTPWWRTPWKRRSRALSRPGFPPPEAPAATDSWARRLPKRSPSGQSARRTSSSPLGRRGPLAQPCRPRPAGTRSVIHCAVARHNGRRRGADPAGNVPTQRFNGVGDLSIRLQPSLSTPFPRARERVGLGVDGSPHGDRQQGRAVPGTCAAGWAETLVKARWAASAGVAWRAGGWRRDRVRGVPRLVPEASRAGRPGQARRYAPGRDRRPGGRRVHHSGRPWPERT